MSLLGQVLAKPAHGPRKKRLKGRDATKAVRHQLSGVGSVRLATLVLAKVGFLDKAGGGEPELPLLIASFLQGWGPILRQLFRLDLLKASTKRLLVRFACTPQRLMVVDDQLQLSSTRCSDKTCLFREVRGRGVSKCFATHADRLGDDQMNRLLLTVPQSRWTRARVPGDDRDFPQRVVETFLRPLEARFQKQDRLKAARPALPGPLDWIGTTFQRPLPHRPGHSDTFTVLATRQNKSGRVVELHLHQRTMWGQELTAWGKVRGHLDGWQIQLSAPHRRWQWRTDLTIAAFPDLKLFL